MGAWSRTYACIWRSRYGRRGNRNLRLLEFANHDGHLSRHYRERRPGVTRTDPQPA